jgi:transposase
VLTILIEGEAYEFEELTEDQGLIRPHLPPRPKVGRKRADDRKTINAILYVLITRCRWRDMPVMRYCLEKVERMVRRKCMEQDSD